MGALPAAREEDAVEDRLAHAALGRDRAGQQAALDPGRPHQARAHRVHLQPAHDHQGRHSIMEIRPQCGEVTRQSV